MKKLSIYFILGIVVLLGVTGCADDETTTISSNVQGIYESNSRNSTTGICRTYALKVNETTVEEKFFSESGGCTTDLDFSNGDVTTYEIRDIKVTDDEDVSFNLYLNDVKEYECIRSFGSLGCTSKTGSYTSYSKVD